MRDDGGEFRTGLIHAFGAYSIWGLLPIYFKLLSSIGPIEVLAHRVLWSFLFILLVLKLRGELGGLRAALQMRTMLALTASSVFIGLNWLIYVWSVVNHHIIAASLGYFLNPLVNVLLGISFLGERLRPFQWLAIAFAAVGVAILASGAPQTLGISLSLALSFGFYGLIRKLTPVPPLVGLGIETMVLLPLAIAALFWIAAHAGFDFGKDAGQSALLVAAGIVTSVPLLLFASGARRLPLVMLGLIQYVAPTMQFLVGVVLYGETLSQAQWSSFALIWTGLFLFAGYAVWQRRAAPV